jgi:SAM-dependent methyltransferase
MWHGVIGGTMGYALLRRFWPHSERQGLGEGSAYRNRSKLEVLFGPQFWSVIRGKDIIDFGCGLGGEAIEMAQRGARRVIGIDNRQTVLDTATQSAKASGVGDRCQFVLATVEQADVVTSIDGFEHYDDPAQVLLLLRRMVRPSGRVLISFGPPWLHPLGGHLFSVFPWAHLLFSERALIRWRADFKTDGATRFYEVEGGLNQMTLRRFRALVDASPFKIEQLELMPIRRLRLLSNRWTREFLTSTVRCTLAPATLTATSRRPGPKRPDHS